MGSKIVSPIHVKKLIKQFSKDKHLLCDSDLGRMFNLVLISERLYYLSNIVLLI